MYNLSLFKNKFNIKYLEKLYENFVYFLPEEVRQQYLALKVDNFIEADKSRILINVAKYTEDFLLQYMYRNTLSAERKDLTIRDYQEKREFLRSYGLGSEFKLDFNNLLSQAGKFDCDDQIDYGFNFKGFKKNVYINANINYCLKCHDRSKDSCRNGLIDKDGKNIKNLLETDLFGCPLKMHISEAITLKENGYDLAALMLMMINNPLVILTGYRICIDCSQSCIFQKQTQVDVPSIESKILQDILERPYGIEIYMFLTQFNPLNITLPIPSKKQYKKICVIGAGASGISASFHLMRQGFNVHILEANLVKGIDKRFKNKLIKDSSVFINKPLEGRSINGFGGVLEYGVTSRWNKNYLDIVHLLLIRNPLFKISDGIRLGSNYTMQNALDQHAHIVLASGASKQRWPSNIKFDKEIKNDGTIKFAADFLINLQLLGAYKKDNNVNLQIMLPAIVIGGGLTAIDCATEVANYMFRQVDKVAAYYHSNQSVIDCLTDIEKKLLYELLEIKSMTAYMSKSEILKTLGSVKVLYHRNIIKSSAYKSNHNEINEALKMGIEFIDNVRISSINILQKDPYIKYSLTAIDGQTFEARSIFIATGFDFNNIILKESGFDLMSGYNKLLLDWNSKSNLIHKNISVCGDAHPLYRGSVVKALDSGFNVSKEISGLQFSHLRNIGNGERLLSKVISIIKKTKDRYLLIVRTTNVAVNNMKEGHFFKLDYYNKHGTTEKIALTPVYIDRRLKQVHFIIKIDGSSKQFFVNNIAKGDKILCIGPLGHESKQSYGSYLQCMMRGMCGQCYVLKNDGSIEYSCESGSNGNHVKDHANSLQEKLTYYLK